LTSAHRARSLTAPKPRGQSTLDAPRESPTSSPESRCGQTNEQAPRSDGSRERWIAAVVIVSRWSDFVTRVTPIRDADRRCRLRTHQKGCASLWCCICSSNLSSSRDARVLVARGTPLNPFDRTSAETDLRTFSHTPPDRFGVSPPQAAEGRNAMNTHDQHVTFADLLRAAVEQPGRIHEAYFAFHGYSVANRVLALIQCAERGIAPGPVASFNRWKERGRC